MAILRAIFIGGGVMPYKGLDASVRAGGSFVRNTVGRHRNDMSGYLPNGLDQTLVTCRVTNVIS